MTWIFLGCLGHTDNIFNQMLTVTVNCDNRLSRKVLTDYFFLNVSKCYLESCSFSFIDRMGKDSRSNKSRFVVIVVIAWATPIINKNNTGFREFYGNILNHLNQAFVWFISWNNNIHRHFLSVSSYDSLVTSSKATWLSTTLGTTATLRATAARH